MQTLKEHYCRKHGCSDATFEAALFWWTLYGVARPLVPLFGGRQGRHFAPDRDLLAAAAGARTMDALREAIRDYVNDLENRRFWRRVGRVRISTRKLKRFARPYLPDPHRLADTDTRPPL